MFGQQFHVGEVALRVPVLGEHPPAVQPVLGAAEAHPRQPRVVAELDTVIATVAVAQPGQQVAAHVRGGGDVAVARGRFGSVVGGRHDLLRTVPAVAGRDVGVEDLRRRLGDGAAGHPERREDVLLDVVRVRLAGGQLDEVTGKGVAVVRVRRVLAGRTDAAGDVVGDLVGQAGQRRALRGEDAVHLVFEARGVCEQVEQCHRTAGEGVGELELRQVPVDVGMQVELAPRDELQGRGGRERLAHGVDQELGAVRVDLGFGLDARHAVTGREHLLPARDDHHGGAGDVRGGQFCGQRVEDLRRLGGVHRCLSLWRGLCRLRSEQGEDAGREDGHGFSEHAGNATNRAADRRSGELPGRAGAVPTSRGSGRAPRRARRRRRCCTRRRRGFRR